MARVRRRARHERADLAEARRVVLGRHDEHRDRELAEPLLRRGARRGERLDAVGQRVRVGRRAPQLPDPLVGAQRSPDLEVDRHRRLQIAFGLGRVVPRALLLGVRRAVVTGQPRRDADDRPQSVGMRERDVEGDPAAEGEADERRPLDSELVEDADDVLLPRPRHGRPGRAAEEAEVGADRPKALGEEGDDRLPQPRVAEPAVQQEHRRALSRLVVPDARAADVDYRHGPTL